MSGIRGARELDIVLRKLPRAVSQDILLRSLRVGANVIKREAQRQAPPLKTTPWSEQGYLFRKWKYGHLFENIKVTQTKHRGGAAQMTVHTGDAYWGLWLEFGTGLRRTKYGKGQSRGSMSAQPWFSVAFEAKHREALDKVGERLGINIEKAAAMLAGPRSKMTKAFRRRL